ncbi:phage tail tape measure protein [Kitasatospora sp. A2-31]|uniref:phage tail tape measure protein n=1 Tax=Kitasatospora sp. A2-31 TaxID=2916414 RepID=UPI001EE898F2|nr:phage tail tape measure protein [Kitasatospora sp. A2-31]MCG6493444.1 phage tail tape measure protein [Kitasatospora sp. A2-31]
MNIVEIVVTAKNLTGPAFAEAKAGASAMESSMGKLNAVANASAVALAAVGFEAVKMASKFDGEMSLLVTQAGVAEDQLDGLKKGVLGIAAKVGQDPDSLAEALFHVESNFESMGITSQQALKLTETAAKGAAVGHADLVDVTNALTAAVAAGIPGVEDLDQAMGVLNATVGVGDMKMQDLAQAFGSGMVATVKGFGLTIEDVGAALAVFGDNNIRGSLAGNQLRMSVMALAKPVSTSEAALKTLGLTATTLAEDMQRGGLKLALEDLVGRMNAAGITADQQGQIITDAFGRKAGAGLNVLVGQMERLESKYPALEEGAKGFGAAWERTQQTFQQQTRELEGSLQALMITLGEKLIPPLQHATTWMLNNRDTMIEMAKGVGVVVAALAGFAVLSKVIAGVQTLVTAFQAVGGAMAAYYTRVIEAQAASVAATGGVNGLGAAFTALSTKAKIAVSATALGLIVAVAYKLSESSQKAAPSVDRMTTSLEALGHAGAKSGQLTETFGGDLEKLSYAVDRVAGKASGMDKFNDTMNAIFSLGMAKSNSLKDATKQINSIDEALAGMVQGGHADLAAAALKKLQDALAAKGGDAGQLGAEMHKYQDALAATAQTEEIAAASMGELGKQAMETSKHLDEQKMTAKGLKEAISDLNDVNRSALDAMAGFEAAIDDAAKAATENSGALKINHGELDLTSEKSRTAEAALTDLASKTDAAGVAALNSGESMEYVNKIYDRGRDKLMQVAMQMGLTREEARHLTDEILATPDKTAYLRGDVEDLKAKLADAEWAIRGTTGEKRVRLQAEIDGLKRDLAEAQAQVNALHGKTIYITEYFQMGGGNYSGSSAGRFAHGGIIGGAATGGPRGGLTWVGEQGPELVRLPGGSTVIPAGQSRTMADASAADGGGPLVLEIRSGGSRLDDLLVELLRNAVRVRGGNVQTVLGRA